MSFNYGLKPGTTQKVSPSGSSAATAAKFGTQRVASDADLHIVFAVSPTATANDIFLPADQPEIFKVSPGEKMAALGSGNVSVTEMSA